MKENETTTVGLIQTSVSEDLTGNLETALKRAAQAADRGAQIICLQELYRTPYFPHEERVSAARFAETIPGESTDAFTQLAREKNAAVIVPLYEKTAGGAFFNSAAVIDADGSLLPPYRKIHIPFDKYFYEKNYFAPGDSGFRVYKTKHATFAVLICFDQWYPEAARIATLMGADIIFYPTAIGWIKDYTSPDGDWRDAWETVQRGHAIANGIHVCAVNRAGAEGELKFWGGSFACDSFGAVIQKAGEDDETLVVPLDLSKNKRIREGWGFLANRRPETYGKLCGKGNDAVDKD
ncbi:MAG: carbon-nitrogen hydrolase [bacterium]